MPTTHILIIDADTDRAASVAARARSDEWDVSTAASIAAAQQAIADRPIALALADSSIWRRDELSEWMSREHPALPVIVLTGRDETARGLVQKIQLGPMTFVPRDADRRRLIETIGTIVSLTRRNPHRESVRPFLRAGEIELHVGNDPAIVSTVVGYVQRVLEDYGLSSPAEQTRIGIALTEALANAMIHGNLEVGSECRTEQADLYYKAIEERKQQEPYKDRAVQFILRFSQSSATFVVRDQGKGFDPAALPDPTDPENLLLASGRGILLMRAYTDAISWNEAGTEVTLVKVLKPTQISH